MSGTTKWIISEISRPPPCADSYCVETGVYDTEELHTNCTVQVLKNSITGEISVGWWENADSNME